MKVYNDEQILSEMLVASETDRRNYEKEYYKLSVRFRETADLSENNKYQTVDLCLKSTKVIDYLSQVRMKTIEELRKAQKDSLEYYKLNSSHFKSGLTEQKNIEKFKSELFTEDFFFQIHFTKKKLWTFSLFTFSTNFYVSSSDIVILEYNYYII